MECPSEVEMESKMKTLVYRVRDYLEENHNLNYRSQCVPFVRRCIRQKKGNVRKAANLIAAVHGVMKEFDDWNSTLKPSLYNDLYTRDISYFNVLSQRDDQGRYVFLLRPGVWDPQEVNFEELVTCLWMFLQYANAYVEDVRNDGWSCIFDFNDFTMEQGLALSLSTCIALTKWGQTGVAGKMKAAHLVNHPSIIGVLLAGCKPFLSEKIKNRIILHKNVESLLEHVPARILPLYLNGTANEDSYRDKTWLYELIQQDKFFEDMVKYGLPTK